MQNISCRLTINYQDFVAVDKVVDERNSTDESATNEFKLIFFDKNATTFCYFCLFFQNMLETM